MNQLNQGFVKCYTATELSVWYYLRYFTTERHENKWTLRKIRSGTYVAFTCKKFQTFHRKNSRNVEFMPKRTIKIFRQKILSLGRSSECEKSVITTHSYISDTNKYNFSASFLGQLALVKHIHSYFFVTANIESNIFHTSNNFTCTSCNLRIITLRKLKVHD